MLVDSATPFKLEQNKNENRSIDKCRIWEKKEGKYAKSLAKIQVTSIFLKQDMRRYFFTPIHRDLYEEAMLVPI